MRSGAGWSGIVALGLVTAGCQVLSGLSAVEVDDAGGTTTSATSGSAGSGGATSASSTSAGGASASSSAGTGGAGGSTSAATGTGGGSSVCGDGKKEGGEECDDGNTLPGDRCGPTCAIEDPTMCPGTPILLGATPIVISDSTVGASDKATDAAAVGNCINGAWPGADLVYAVEPTENGTLSVVLDASYTKHEVHVRTTCPGTKQAEIACHYGDAPGADSVSLPVSAGATYYVFPDSWANQAGTFTLTLALMP
jgi:cysteine-rich repeat protein